MNLQDLVRVIRSRWLIIFIATLAGLLGAVAVTLLTKPLYQASTRLFVSTTAGASASELYQGNRLSQERVISYTELLKGQTLSQRTVDKLQLDMSAEQLRAKIRATSKLDTVLINLSVLDESPVRARDIANSLSDEFVVMIRELETPTPGVRPDARVVVEQRATVPEAPVVPKTSQNVTYGLAVGLLFGIGLVIVRDRLDNTTKSAASLEEITGVGVVGVIPRDDNVKNEVGISFESGHSAIAEAFRKLRTNLQFLAVDNPPRQIVITSAVPGEGKSTTAVNLALALAEADNNVVLVDGDLRRPSLGKYLNLIGEVGFSTVLSGAATLSEVLQVTKYSNLTVLTSGPTPPNPSELLGSRMAKNALNELRARFDYVIIDSAPLLAVTDGAILATQADGALIIHRFGKTKREELRHAVGTLNDVGATVLGALLTMAPARGRSAYGYGYGYGYYGSDSNGTEADNLGRNTLTVEQPNESRST